MAYARDLSAFPLTRFAAVLKSVALLPGRLVLAEHIDDVVSRLVAEGVTDLDALRKMLARKGSAHVVADRLGVDVEYLTLLRREVNSYRTKALPLRQLEVFSDGELERLAANGIRSTEHLYDACLRRADRAQLARTLDVAPQHIEDALGLANLSRIGGVGPAFAWVLMNLGIRGPDELLALESNEVVNLYNASLGNDPAQPRVVSKDIDYCKRYAEGLQADIEW